MRELRGRRVEEGGLRGKRGRRGMGKRKKRQWWWWCKMRQDVGARPSAVGPKWAGVPLDFRLVSWDSGNGQCGDEVRAQLVYNLRKDEDAVGAGGRSWQSSEGGSWELGGCLLQRSRKKAKPRVRPTERAKLLP